MLQWVNFFSYIQLLLGLNIPPCKHKSSWWALATSPMTLTPFKALYREIGRVQALTPLWLSYYCTSLSHTYPPVTLRNAGGTAFRDYRGVFLSLVPSTGLISPQFLEARRWSTAFSFSNSTFITILHGKEVSSSLFFFLSFSIKREGKRWRNCSPKMSAPHLGTFIKMLLATCPVSLKVMKSQCIMLMPVTKMIIVIPHQPREMCSWVLGLAEHLVGWTFSQKIKDLQEGKRNG